MTGTDSHPDQSDLLDDRDDAWDTERARFAAEDADVRARGLTGYPGGDHVPSGGPRIELLGSAFAELTRVLFATEPEAGVAGVLSRVVDLGVRVVPDADLVSVTLRRGQQQGDGYTTPAHSDPLAVKLDQAQYDAGEGPCVTALAIGSLGTAESNDLANDPNWPRFGPVAARLGVGSVLGVGLFPVGDSRHPPVRGALNFYRYAPGEFGRESRETALLLAAHVSVALAYVMVTEAAALRETQFQTALDSRDVIGQAKGILMERRGLDADAAFDVLRRASQDLNIKLRDVAQALAARRGEL
jgi:hypothetical protein